MARKTAGLITVSARRARVLQRAVAQGLLLSVALTGCVKTSSYTPSWAHRPLRIWPGEYRLDGPGGFRRILVTKSRVVSYEIWRAVPGGKLEYLHFSLTSPQQYPIEAKQYSVHSGGKKCDSVWLRLYRDDKDKVVPYILVLGYDAKEEPLDWGRHPVTGWDFVQDRTEISKLTRQANDPNFYGTIEESARTWLVSLVPRCF
jgi:hypothetical protein